jgi:hypothetical protein
VTNPSLLFLRHSLSLAAADDPSQPPHARAFVAWVQHVRMEQCPLLKQLADDAAASTGGARQTAHVAVLGYAASMDDTFLPQFIEALDWLLARQFFAIGRPLTFEVDGLALFGTAVGAARLDPTGHVAARSAVEGLLRQTVQSNRPTDWNESLIHAALSTLIGSPPKEITDGVSADLHAALCAKCLLQTTAAVRATAWDIISSADCLSDGMTRAAAQGTALAYLLRDSSTLRFGSVTVNDVARLLQGISRSMRYWAWESTPRTRNSALARWNVENEYHVQDMLGVILAPYFPDLEDEEWLQSLGHHHPRADFAIPSLNLLVEVKFLREGSSVACSKLVQEVAADASTYLQESSSFRHIIAFVWDDSASTEQHPELRQGLTRITGVHDTIIIPRPAKMVRVTDPKKPKSTGGHVTK